MRRAYRQSAKRRNGRSRSGFTLVEVLAGLVILTLMMGFVVAGVGTASKIYRQETFSAQADMLSSTVERALSDPLRFMKSKTRKVDGKPTTTYRTTYNGTTLADPVLGCVETPSGRQVLYLGSGQSDSTQRVKLLNEGIYGDCTVTLQRQDGTTVDSLPLSPPSGTHLVILNCTVTSMRDASLSKRYTFSYVALGDKFGKKEVSGL